MIDIRALRRSRGLTLTDMALLTGMPARTLAEIEQGARRLEPEPRLILARVLNVPAAQLCA
ncbi:MAG TPA: helix-turn-helix transcriptional regulator, partial [Kouleothrix sp.]|nr:helix-turn-helix transcriptional regulator [Kouleothrix sp.]